ncbi:hypothetical protein C8P63_102151 [Melghirimyces profundicolus]|uniref:Uncharacterized protein n=1 Tax=Melghirimyces profundicolus TaxID=1242148 RepID=A0A2T6C8L7_9BACL|nr:hypothetical protein C8P63_102151 [Melghirimyces profundicolus]
MTEFILFYNEERIHGTLTYQAPATFYKAVRKKENPELEVRLYPFLLGKKPAIVGIDIKGEAYTLRV